MVSASPVFFWSVWQKLQNLQLNNRCRIEPVTSEWWMLSTEDLRRIQITEMLFLVEYGFKMIGFKYDVVYVVLLTTLCIWDSTISIYLKQYNRNYLETLRETTIGLRILNVPEEYRSGQHSDQVGRVSILIGVTKVLKKDLQNYTIYQYRSKACRKCQRFWKEFLSRFPKELH